MQTPATTESGPVPCTAPPLADTRRASIHAALLGMAEKMAELTDHLLTSTASGEYATAADSPEPERPGLYRDRDGDIWQKTAEGWRLCLQRGVAVDTKSVWEWTGGHVQDYGPFVPLATI